MTHPGVYVDLGPPRRRIMPGDLVRFGVSNRKLLLGIALRRDPSVGDDVWFVLPHGDLALVTQLRWSEHSLERVDG